MKKTEIKNFINVIHEKLCFDNVQNAYFDIYKEPNVDETTKRLQEIFAYWHYQINSRFEDLNSYINRGYSYYEADRSCSLITDIAEINIFIKKFKNTELEFSLNKYYHDLFIECKTFLSNSGTEIPDNFKAVDVLYSPVFLFTGNYIENKNKSYELKLIGEGAYSNVFKYYDEEYQQNFALKRLKTDVSEKDRLRFKKEFELMKKNPFPYIVTVYGINSNYSEYSMELCPHNLDKYIFANNTKLTYKQRKNIAMQFLKALSYLHSKGILHRDLSYRNILIQTVGGVVIVKVSDFGLAKDFKEPITSNDSSLKGTLPDPCLSAFKDYDIKNEIYSVGFILWFIFTGKKNFAPDGTAISDITAKCTDKHSEKRYNSVDEIFSVLSDIKKEDDPLPQKITVNELKEKIIETLISYSAIQLPAVCAGIGLDNGTEREALKSKRSYVFKRLHKLDMSACLELVSKINENLGITVETEKIDNA